MTGYNYPFGNTISEDRANYFDSGDPWDNGTTPVGMYNGQIIQGFQTIDSPSPYGAYDMAGNVTDWTDSWYSSYGAHVVRGGAWNTSGVKSWYRSYFYPSDSNFKTGFRCTRTP